MTDTVKEQALVALAAVIAGVQTSYPTDNPFYLVDDAHPAAPVFSAVYREPPKDAQIKGKKRVAAVLESTEDKVEKSYPAVDGTLQCYVEVHIFRDTGQTASTEVNRALGLVEKLIRDDRTLGGVTREVLFKGSDSTPEGPYSNYASGVLKMSVQYRHHQDDPRQRV